MVLIKRVGCGEVRSSIEDSVEKYNTASRLLLLSNGNSHSEVSYAEGDVSIADWIVYSLGVER